VACPPAAIGVVQRLLDVAGSVGKAAADCLRVAVRIGCPNIIGRAGDQIHHRRGSYLDSPW
jgi:hypothetical protein